MCFPNGRCIMMKLEGSYSVSIERLPLLGQSWLQGEIWKEWVKLGFRGKVGLKGVEVSNRESGD